MIIAIDPGVTTGVATWSFTRDGDIFASTQFTEHQFYDWIDEVADTIDHCQCEAFTITSSTVKKTIVYDSLYLIGYMRYKAWKHEFPLGFTKPADVMGPFHDPALKRAGMFKPGMGHANDASRHLAHYLVRNKVLPGSLFLPK